MPLWLWVPGAPGSPLNDGWLEIFSYSSSLSNEVTCSVGLDTAYPKLMELAVKGTQLDDVVIYREPHHEFHFLKAFLSAVQSSREAVRLSFVYGSLERYYDGGQY